MADTNKGKSTAVAKRKQHQVVQEVLEQRSGELDKLLKSQNIPTERFIRTAVNAVIHKPSLLEANRQSLYTACMLAAQDGLLLDNREAALVPFKGEVQYMPMVYGLLKKIRSMKGVTTARADVVYEFDDFEIVSGDEEHYVHKPKIVSHDGKAIDEEDRGEIIGAYAIVRFTDGYTEREFMPRYEIDKVRKMSRAKREDAPWSLWYSEMAKKSVIRRIAKRFPQLNEDIYGVFKHDDEFFGREDVFDGETLEGEADASEPSTPKKASEAVKAAAAKKEAESPKDDDDGVVDAEFEEVSDEDDGGNENKKSKKAKKEEPPEEDDGTPEDAGEEDDEDGEDVI